MATTASGVIEVRGEYASRAKLAWARLIRKVYEADPLVCDKCKGPIRMVALIEDPAVVRASLTHLGLWQRRALERAPLWRCVLFRFARSQTARLTFDSISIGGRCFVRKTPEERFFSVRFALGEV